MIISIHEICKNDMRTIELGRNLFMNYFMDLYKGISPEKLRIKNETKAYLNNIFDHTEKSLKKDANLCAFFAYVDDVIVGFTTFGPLEDPTVILVRTLPINLDYKEMELNIRKKFVTHVREKYPAAKKVVIMVRKANILHQNLCLDAGFRLDEKVFIDSEYIKDTYDTNSYNGYSYNF